MIIAIDGPAGSGKSTIAKILAERLNCLYLDTGAMYRALTYSVLNKEIDLEDKNRIIEESMSLDIWFKEGKVFLGSEDITSSIREPLVDKSISMIAKIPEVRSQMVGLQRRIAQSRDCIIEGRDTATVVFPEAELKIFLDADIKERAKRRCLDFEKKNISINIDDLKEDLKTRDEADITRETGPLKKAQDSVYLDTTVLGIDEVVDKVYNLAQERGIKRN